MARRKRKDQKARCQLKKINALLNFLLKSLGIKHKVTQTGEKSKMDGGGDKVWFKNISPWVPFVGSVVIISSLSQWPRPPQISSHFLPDLSSRVFPPNDLAHRPPSPLRAPLSQPTCGHYPSLNGCEHFDSHFIPTLCSNSWIKLLFNLKMSIFSLLTPSHQPPSVKWQINMQKKTGKAILTPTIIIIHNMLIIH